MNQESFKALKKTPTFENLLEMSQALLESVMSAPTEAIDTEAAESASEMDMEEEVATPKIAEVLVEVPKSPRMLSPKPTPTKETVKDKKGKQPAILLCTSPRRNPPKPTKQEKGKAINLELEEEEIEDISMDDEDVGVDVEEVEA